jgi:hypothetical protein
VILSGIPRISGDCEARIDLLNVFGKGNSAGSGLPKDLNFDTPRVANVR